MILLDTHAWLWWLYDPNHLCPRARETIDTASTSGGVAVSTISTWERALLVRKGRLELRLPVRDLESACAQLPFFRFIAVDVEIAIASVELDGLHADPADRLIVATARHAGLDLITRDERLQTLPGIRTIW